MSEKKTQQPTNKVVSFEETYYRTARKVNNPKIADVARQLNIKTTVPTKNSTSAHQATSRRKARISKKEAERKQLKNYRDQLIPVVIFFVVAMIALSLIPTHGVPGIVVTIVRILYTVATILVIGAVAYYFVLKYQFKKKYSE